MHDVTDTDHSPDPEIARRHAEALITRLVETEALELVNHWGRRTLADSVSPLLEAGGPPAEQAAAVAEHLLHAPEVAELFIEDEDLERLIAELARA